MKRIMALDIGDARIGIAMSDPLGITAQPHSVVERTGQKSIPIILTLAETSDVDTIIIGMPLELDGTKGPQAEKVEEYVRQLRSGLERRKELQGMNIVYWDERLTTVEAKRYLAGSKLKDRDSRAALDKIAATLMLEGYLESRSFQSSSAVMSAHTLTKDGGYVS